MKKTCYVTTPIYYASGNVHIGNSYTTIACDIFARYHRLKGNDTYYLTGMDEHGQKIEEAAKKANRTPKEHVDRIAAETKQLWKELNINYDDFIQTSEPRHTTVVQQIFEKLLATGDIYLGKYEGDYCVSCETYFTKTQMKEPGICPDCGQPTRIVAEECYFLKMSKYAHSLLDYIKEHPDFIQPESRKNEVVSFVESGLEDLAISRTTFRWGIEILSNPKHVVYVWIDALSNYISALGYLSNDDKKFKKYWLKGDEIVHVVGKDILRFHAVIWPIMLMALQVPIRFKLYVHGWVLMKGGKMSKSKGNVIYPREVVNRYGLDPFRLYLAKEMPLGNDCLFTYERFVEKYNVDLANDLGNLVSRTIAMINKYFDGTVKKPEKQYLLVDSDLEKTAQDSVLQYHEGMAAFRLQNGINAIWNLINRTNKYIDETVPWTLAKDENKKAELMSVMYHLFESIRMTAIMLAPVMPDTAKAIFSELGLKEQDFSELEFGRTESAKVTDKPEVLFRRLDMEAEMKYHDGEKEAEITDLLKPEITIDDFSKLDLRVGEVLECEKMEKSDKLLILKVKINNTVRQIVSGIAKDYDPKEMVGKKVVVVANLKPVQLRGHVSEGMILAASGEGLPLEVLEVKKHNSDSKVS